MSLFGRVRRPPFRLFFATDVHGSDRCFRKFLAAAKAYDADALVLGGDVAGKAMIPMTPQGDGSYAFTFHGAPQLVGADQLDEVNARLNFNGFYPRITEQDELERMREEPGFVEELFAQEIVQQLSGWCDLAAERLADDVRCIITPGNDDPFAIDAVLEAHARVECPERETVEVGPMWLASLGNTNRTPWDTDREYDEDELGWQIAEMVEPFADGRPLVFNFHCPPHGSGLDVAAKLDEELRPVMQGGAPVEIPVGSTAVREAIERYQPVAGLHGHIHESHGVRKLGRSMCFNPGSEYGSGVLKGLILDLEENGEYKNHLLTAG